MVNRLTLCTLLKCESTEIEEMVRQTFVAWTWEGQAIARVKTLKDALGAKLKERRPTVIHSSWVPNYDQGEDLTEKFTNTAHGNWHNNPRFKYERVWGLTD